MGKSKSGGTRGYIRGRIANDVYSIGKDGKGKKQQVIRSLAESVANPRTTAQMRGRMIMSTIMQFVSGASAIIDHAFDGVATGQPSISEFIRLNYALVKADVAAHPSSGNSFGLVKFGEKTIKNGCYQISSGKAQFPATASVDDGSVVVSASVDATEGTVGNFLENLGIDVGDYVTTCGLVNGQFVFTRFSVKESVDKTALISAASADDIFETEGWSYGFVSATSGSGTKGFSLGLYDEDQMPVKVGASILTKKVDNGYIHSTAVFKLNGETAAYTADVALPTYPTGSEQILNGGDI